jgi:four helix bundle protein
MSYGSLSETVTLLHIARGAELISEGQLARARAEIGRICRMLSGLKRSALEAS